MSFEAEEKDDEKKNTNQIKSDDGIKNQVKTTQ